MILKFGKNVVELKKTHRLCDDAKDLKRMLSDLRNKGGVSEEDAIHLERLHLTNPSISKERREEIEKDAIWIFYQNEKVADHNEKKLLSLVSEDNPLVQCIGFLQGSRGKKPVRRHFSQSQLKNMNCEVCRQCRTGLIFNIWAEKAMYNGATGTIIEIRYNEGESPLKGDLPAYIIVEFDTYTGPVWDEKFPKRVPIAPIRTTCEHGCCSMTHMPLSLSFARTMHK